MNDGRYRARLYHRIERAIKKIGLNLADVPPQLRANVTREEMSEINHRYIERYIAALGMEKVLVDVLNGTVDKVIIEEALNKWRAAL